MAELRAENAGLNARVAALAAEVARLQETVTTLSGLLFGSSRRRAARPRGGTAGSGLTGRGARKRGQQPGARGMAAGIIRTWRPRSASSTWRRQRCCAACGTGYEFIGTEDSEQVDWRVTLIRILLRRRRYRRRCTCAGPKTICAPPAPRVVPRGLFTAGFLARLLHEKHVLGARCTGSSPRWPPRGWMSLPAPDGELRQIAPLLGPWAQAIAAHGRQPGRCIATKPPGRCSKTSRTRRITAGGCGCS